MKIIIATLKSWNIERAKRLKERYAGKHEITIYTTKEELTIENVEQIQPDYIFMPHWSFYVPNEITQAWHCVVFHMTDLPYGRGGSPLQNLIVRGKKETMISAIRVSAAFDEGPVYMKYPLSLDGAAHEIFERCSEKIFEQMIPRFLTENLVPQEQQGEPVIFKRRKPQEGALLPDMSPETIYDYIRMLDAEGYPRAFISFGEYQLEFEDAHLSADGSQVEAKVSFIKKQSS